jgi:hypothetical protein
VYKVCHLKNPAAWRSTMARPPLCSAPQCNVAQHWRCTKFW